MCDSTKRALSGSVISRAPRSNVTYDHAQWIMTIRSVAKADQEENVDEQPEQPGEVARGLDRPDLGDGGTPADRGQHSFVDDNGTAAEAGRAERA